MIEEKISFKSYDFGANGKPKISTYLKFMQESAQNDLEIFGVEFSELRKAGAVFVLVKLNLEIYDFPEEGKEYILKTSSEKIQGVSFYRNFSCSDKNKKIFGAASRWVLLDYNTRRILRPQKLGMQLPEFNMENPGFCDFGILDSATVFSEKRKIYPSMLDENNHMNNSVYADIISDSVPEDFDIKQISIDYIHEIKCGEILTVKTYKSENGYKVTGTLDDTAEIFKSRVR